MNQYHNHYQETQQRSTNVSKLSRAVHEMRNRPLHLCEEKTQKKYVHVNGVTFNRDDIYHLFRITGLNLDYVQIKTEDVFLYTDEQGKPLSGFESESIKQMIITYDDRPKKDEPNYEIYRGEHFEIKVRLS